MAGFTLNVPPLRERREDIPLLVDHFLRLFAAEMGQEPSGLSREALGVLEEHDFPGNVRELKNLIEYALIRSRGTLIRPEHLRFIEFRGGGGEEQAGSWGRQVGRAASAEEQIRAYVEVHGAISNTECRDLLSIDLQRASYLLKKLHAQGLLERQGARRWSRYHLSSSRS